MKRIAAALLALLALALLRRREQETVCRTDWHGEDDEGDALAPDPYLASLAADADRPDAARAGFPTRAFSGSSPDSGNPPQLVDLERMGLLYWHTNADGRVQPVIQPLPEEGRRK